MSRGRLRPVRGCGLWSAAAAARPVRDEGGAGRAVHGTPDAAGSLTVGRFVRWLDERLDIVPLWRAFMDRPIPRGVGWFHTLGSATLVLLSVQFATGIFLTVYSRASTDHASQSIQFLTHDVLFAPFVRGMLRSPGSLLAV